VKITNVPAALRGWEDKKGILKKGEKKQNRNARCKNEAEVIAGKPAQTKKGPVKDIYYVIRRGKRGRSSKSIQGRLKRSL